LKLHYNVASPFVRKVMVVAIETGLDGRLEPITRMMTPVKPDADLAADNPLGKSPCLVTDDGAVLYDSRVICEYLDERFPHPPLMPVDSVSRAKARLVVSRIERDWYELLDRLEVGGARDTADARKHLSESLASSDEVFGSGMPFFLSEELTVMDCALGPLLWRLPHYGVELPPSAGHVHEYADRLFAREGFRKSLSDVERAMRAV
jgi:RNA polymerase-associated protein